MEGRWLAFAALFLFILAGLPIGRSADPPDSSPTAWLESSIGDPRTARWVDLALDGAGRPHIAYIVQGPSNSEDRVAYARWHNGDWIREDVGSIGIWDGEDLRMRPWGQFLYMRRDPAQGSDALYLTRHIWSPPGDWEMLKFVGSDGVLDFAAGRTSAYAAAAAVENGSLADVRYSQPWGSATTLGTFGEFLDLAVAVNATGATHVFIAAGPVLYDVWTESTWWGTWTTTAIYATLSPDAIVRADAGPDGAVHVVVATAREAHHFEFDGGAWREESIASDVASCANCAVADLYVNQTGVPYVLYETVAGALRLVHRVEGEWRERTLPPTVQGHAFSLAVPDDRVSIAFVASDGDLRLATEAALPWVPAGILGLSTDRCSYVIGNPVNITLSNSGNATLGWPGAPPEFWIYNESGGIVFRIWFQLTMYVTLAPGESMNLSWSQRYSLRDENGWYPIPPDGEQVPAGLYRIVFEAGTGDATWSEPLVAQTTIAIGVPCPSPSVSGDLRFGGGPRGTGPSAGP